MIRSYSQRLLPPYSGYVQIAESSSVRALSFDGVSWDIQYISGGDGVEQERARGYALDRGYYNVAHLHNSDLKMFNIPAFLDAEKVTESIHELSEFLATAKLPFLAADIYEYWLLDAVDESPLALIFSCCDESQMSGFPGKTEWTALPDSKMKVDKTEHELEQGLGPVNQRLQDLVTRRAGGSPRATWFKREQDDSDQFPSLLVREDWHDETSHDVCQRYLMRKASRLLMLHDIPEDDRERLELAAKQQVFEVEESFRLYPEINDQQRLSAMRVEARLRQSVPQATGKKADRKAPEDKRMSKDMRIFET